MYIDPSILCFRLSHDADNASREQLEQWPTDRAPKQSDKQVTMLNFNQLHLLFILGHV